MLLLLRYVDQYYQSLIHVPQLYPQTANENLTKIKESRLVDKVVEKPTEEINKTLLPN